ncbi:hypothetical protein HY546_00405 [archaeon]|nr:hypothetical protein [archaeon]
MFVCNGGAVRVSFENGETLFLDATFRCRTGVAGVSHGHSDHLRRHSVSTIASQQTVDLFPSFFSAEGSKGSEGSEGSKGSEYGQQLAVGKALVSLHDAGHVLGSAQFRVEADGQVLAYTGDLKVSPSALFSGAEQLECDTLVIESTFGSPKYAFPSAKEVGESLSSWVATNADSNIVIGAYQLGKTQELVSILNDMGVQPIVSKRAAQFCHVYDWHGFRQDFLEAGTPESEASREHAFVEIVPPALLQDAAWLAKRESGRRTLTSLTTGWAGTPLARKCDRSFPLSGHSDFKELVEYALSSGSKRVYTVNGFDRELAAHLRKRGLQARPLHSAQSHIFDW